MALFRKLFSWLNKDDLDEVLETGKINPENIFELENEDPDIAARIKNLVCTTLFWISQLIKDLAAGLATLLKRTLPSRPIRKTAYILLSANLIAVTSIPVLNIIQPSEVEAAWYNEDWQYRQSQLLTHVSPENNVYVNFSGANALDTSTSGKFQADCGDIRFTDAAGNELPYYLVSGCGTSTTVVHVLFSTLPAGEQYIYFYYGNPTVANGTTGFDFSTAATGVTFGSRGTEESSAGPVAEWKFDEGYGTTTKNSNSGQYTGTLTSGPTWQPQENCVSGKCLRFDGVDDNVTISNATPLQITGDITIEAWVFPIDNTLYQPIVSKDSSNEYEIAADFRTGADLATRWEGAQKNFSGFFNGYTNRWVHVAVTVSGSTISAYRNGALVGTTTGVSRTISTNNVTIGKRTGGSFWFKGLIDQVKIYDYAMTLNQLQWQYVADSQQLVKQGGNLQNGLVGYWKMDEPSWNGTTGEVKDKSGAGADASILGGGGVTTGKFGNGGLLDGVDDYIKTGATVKCALNQTVSVWINSEVNANTSVVSEIESCGGRFLLQRTGSGGFGFYPHSASPISGSTPVYSTNAWHLVTATTSQVSATEVEAIIYVDGKSVLAKKIVFSSPSLSPGIASFGSFPAGGDRYFKGRLDEARIYHRTLSSAEVQQLYNFAPGPLAQYKFEEASGTTFYDSSGNGLNGTSPSTPRVEGRHGYGVNITPSVNRITSSNTTPPFNITIGAWVKPNAFGGHVAGYDLSTYALGTTADYKIIARVNDGTSYVDATSSTVFSAGDIGKWHYIAMTYDGAAVKFYLNGTYISQSSVSLVALQTPRAICIGYCSITYFDGDIDDVTLYSYARTPQQIVEDMNGGSIATAGPSAYWKFDESQGSTVKDSSGNGLEGTITSCSWATSGKYGSALDCSGGNGYISMGNPTAFQSKDLSISTWIKTGTINAGGGYDNMIMGKETYQESGFRYGINGSGKLVFWTSQSGGTLSISSNNSINDGKWHHVIISYDSVAAAGRLYVDGKLVGSGSGTFIPNTTANFVVNGGAGGTTRSNSTFDEIKYFSFALSAQDVVADYNQAGSIKVGSSGSETVTTGSGGTGSMPSNSKASQYCVPGDTSPCTAPVGEWKFEEGSGTTAKDTSGNGNDGSYIGTPTWGTGKIGGALSLNGSSYVNAGSTSSLDVAPPITVSVWVNPSQISNLLVNYAVAKFSGDLNAGSDQGWAFGYVGNTAICGGVDGTPFLYDNVANTIICGKTAMSTGKWYYLTFTNDGSTTNIYVNGILETSAAQTITDSAASNFYIGSRDGGGLLMNGLIDQVRAYNYVRTPAQIAWDYNQGKPLAWYKMNECQGNKLHSSSEPYNSSIEGTILIGPTGSQTAIGTCQTAGTAWGNGKVGKREASLGFDGTDDYVNVPGAWLYDYQTVAFWAKANWGSAVGRPVSSLRWSNPDHDGFFFSAMTNQMNVQIYNNSQPEYVQSASVTGTGWHHFVLAWSPTETRFYVDGVLKNATSRTNDFDFNTTDMDIGRYNYLDNDYFSGQIDDVQIYNYALTATQIKTLFNGGSVRWGN